MSVSILSKHLRNADYNHLVFSVSEAMEAAEDHANAEIIAEILREESDDEGDAMDNFDDIDFDDVEIGPAAAPLHAPPSPSSPLRNHAAAEEYGSDYLSDEFADHSPVKKAKISRAAGGGRKKGATSTE